MHLAREQHRTPAAGEHVLATHMVCIVSPRILGSAVHATVSNGALACATVSGSLLQLLPLSTVRCERHLSVSASRAPSPGSCHQPWLRVVCVPTNIPCCWQHSGSVEFRVLLQSPSTRGLVPIPPCQRPTNRPAVSFHQQPPCVASAMHRSLLRNEYAASTQFVFLQHLNIVWHEGLVNLQAVHVGCRL